MIIETNNNIINNKIMKLKPLIHKTIQNNNITSIKIKSNNNNNKNIITKKILSTETKSKQNKRQFKSMILTPKKNKNPEKKIKVYKKKIPLLNTSVNNVRNKRKINIENNQNNEKLTNKIINKSNFVKKFKKINNK